MNAARILLSPESLAEYLCLPDKSRITGVQWDPMRHVIQIRVEGEAMPHYNPGDPLPELNPVYRRIEHELVSLGTEAKS